MNRIRAAITLYILALLVVIARIISQADAGAFPVMAGGETSYDITAKRDLLALMMAYPEDITGVVRNRDGRICVVMRSGGSIVYDDLREKSFDAQLADADLQDMMRQPYPLSAIAEVMDGNTDPGRIRCYAFLREVYGQTQHEIESRLESVPLGSGGCPFNSGNNAAAALEAAFGDISALISRQPEIYNYVYPLSGTYNYRVIAGTGQLSPHAFGIAVDLHSNPYDYWRWATKEQGQSRLESYPQELVQVFEAHGFIWGGKWAHFDFLHFEYRPELIIRAKYTASPAQTNKIWYAGFPENDLTMRCIGIIDRAMS